MIRKLIFIVLVVTFYLLPFTLYPSALADSVEDLQQQINELAHLRELSAAATQPLKAQLKNLDTKIAVAQKGIDAAVSENNRLARELDTRQTEIAVQYTLLAAHVRSFYKQQRLFSPIALFLSSGSADEWTRDVGYRQAITRENRDVIAQITQESLSLESDQKKQQERKIQLTALQGQLDKEATFFRHEVKGAEAYQDDLSNQIAALSKRQQEILNEKAGTFQTTVGDVPPADDPASRPDYNPGFSPAFAAFSFGAPHFRGMSQYGAWGRAKSGQGEEDILKAYYGDVHIEGVDTGGNINTSSGSMDFETRYLYGIAEMPSDWTDNNSAALKAQAIAARSYALSYVGWRMGNRSKSGSICTSEQCQVWNSGKSNNPPQAWKEAVDTTRGKILVSNTSREIVNSWYASTSGGYQESYTSLGHSTPAFWDTKNGRSGWTSDAYEKISGSPWFYKGWYKSRSGDNCGRSHPWLTGEELADILNAWAVLLKSSQGDDRVTPTGSCWGGNPYSIGELKSRSEGAGGGFGKVSNMSVSYSDSGVTQSITFDTDKGSVTIPGSEFKKAFNLRAPGRLAIKSGLFNIEKK